MIGDGMNDAAVKNSTEKINLIAFTGIIRRPTVVSLADYELSSFLNIF